MLKSLQRWLDELHGGVDAVTNVDVDGGRFSNRARATKYVLFEGVDEGC